MSVLQATFDAGYRWDRGSVLIDVTASLGAEINFDTVGEDVGEGAIFLLGVTLTRPLN